MSAVDTNWAFCFIINSTPLSMATSIELSSLKIEKIIVHDIPRHKQNDFSIQPNYSEQESTITDGLRLFFKDKVVSALSSDKAFKISYDPESSSPISWQVSELLKEKGKQLIDISKAIAKHLYEIQVGVNAAGILVVIYGSINKFKTCVILKLERDQGAQLRLDPKTHSFNIQEVKDLMLTQKTKIFKVAMFISRDDFKTKFDGLIMDYQINVKQKKEVSTYFIDKFLGCKAFEDPKVTTKRFYNLTRTYIDTVDDQILKTKYIQDLNSYIQKNNNSLNPKEFADDYMKLSSHKNGYKDYLETKNFKFSSFPKDTQLIDNKVKRIAIVFENDVSIIGNKGAFDKSVKLEELENGKHRAEIISKIKRVA